MDSKRPGFTLIELLVVIAIITLLVGILMPALQRAKELAKDLVCASNQKSIGQALHMYAGVNDDQIPYNTAYGRGVFYLSWCTRIGRMADDKFSMPIPFFTNPVYRKICTTGYIDYNWNDYLEGHFKCPSLWDQVKPKPKSEKFLREHWGHQFSINNLLSQKHIKYHLSDEKNMRCRRFGDVRKPKTILIGDATMWRHQYGTGGLPSYTHMPMALERYDDDIFKVPRNFSYKPTDLYGGSPWPYATSWNYGGSRALRVDFYGHSGEKTNLTFIDGHVEAIRVLKPSLWSIE